ncbi:UPF0764 protein C16orf89 homolog [Branchiostoma floridae x Branchiostoma belcheri]
MSRKRTRGDDGCADANQSEEERYFLNPESVSEHLYCSICQDVFKEPQRAPCGHSYCKQCIMAWLRTSKTCPEDRRPVREKDLHYDFILANIIGDHMVACPFRKLGCEFVGKLELLTSHRKSCCFNPANLPEFLLEEPQPSSSGKAAAAATGQLGLMLETVADGSAHHTVRHVIHRLGRIKVRITRISHHALHLLRSRDMEYFRKFEAVVKEPFLLRTPWKYLRTEEEEQREETMTETWFPGNLSDHCLAEVTGGLNSDKHRDRKCTVSERCWRFITASHTSGYTLSHQILWTILGEHVGCMENIDKYARRRGMLEGTAELRHRHCSSALHHMEALMHRGAAQADQDMFLETSVLCGMLGYRDFLRADWLRTVLAWQLPSGCFGIRHTPTRRRLLGEKLLQHDCLSHKSGLGAAIMGMYARCMMDPACTWRSKSRD